MEELLSSHSDAINNVNPSLTVEYDIQEIMDFLAKIYPETSEAGSFGNEDRLNHTDVKGISW